MSEGTVRLGIEGGIASVLFDRPQVRNAMTWAMYEQLIGICKQLQTDASVRVVTFRGAGGDAFVAGTDIEQFKAFTSGDDGVTYEGRIDHCIGLLQTLPMPTVAVVEGWAVGGGLAIATACDFRVASNTARFGVPIARTLGNCLSMANLAQLCAAFGMQRVKRMLMLAEILDAEEALACGYLHEVCTPADLDATAKRLVERLATLAPVTQSVAKEGLRRLTAQGLPEAEDLIRRAYASADFHEGVNAFVEKRTPVWSGQ
jgi:enoyl-CoA hydratase